MTKTFLPKSNLSNAELEKIIELFSSKLVGSDPYKQANIPYRVSGSLDSPSVYEAVIHSLHHNGFVILDKYLSNEVIDKAKAKLDQLIDSLGPYRRTTTFVERADYTVQNSASNTKKISFI